tara:strand:- start:161 stop:664 length:504 start_codon:yes stop_codon:yes gene_type:complete
MDWKSLAGKLSGFAPVIGTAIGGPAGGIVGSMIASALGVNDSPEAVMKELKNNPDAYLTLKKLESDEKVKLQEFANDTLKAELADKQQAREAHIHSKMPAIVTIMLTVLASGLLYSIMYSQIPQGSENLAMMMFGQVFTLWGASIQYWVGTTRSSAQKTMNSLKDIA